MHHRCRTGGYSVLTFIHLSAFVSHADIDECWIETHNCRQCEVCINARGTFSCVSVPYRTGWVFNPEKGKCEPPPTAATTSKTQTAATAAPGKLSKFLVCLLYMVVGLMTRVCAKKIWPLSALLSKIKTSNSPISTTLK